MTKNFDLSKPIAIGCDHAGVEYKDALRLFEKTSKIFEAPSLLNMGIIYYKQKDEKKAQEFFNKIYSKKTNLINQPYSFISSCYYLFEITTDFIIASSSCIKSRLSFEGA